MIATSTEYEKKQEELKSLEERLDRLQQSNPVGSKGFTKAGIRKMIAHLHEELAVFEGILHAVWNDTFDRLTASRRRRCCAKRSRLRLAVKRVIPCRERYSEEARQSES